MRMILRCVLLLLMAGGICGRADADGKFYGEKIPPDIPYQRGFILFHEGSETLVLQSIYEASDSAAVNSLGWVVPVPSVPEIANADAEGARIFFLEAARATLPRVLSIFGCMGATIAVFFVGSVAFVLLVLLEYPFLNKIGLPKSAWWTRLRNGLIAGGIAFLLFVITAPLGYSNELEAINAEEVGVYHVKVITGQSAEGILGWLKENGFGFGDSDVQVFEKYVNHNWCFVAAKVQPEPGTQGRKIVSGKMVAPLILKFKTDRAIYPLALTSTIGAETEVLLYTLSERKLSCGERLTLRRATKTTQWKFSDLVGDAETQAAALFADVPKSATLCKFKKRLKPQEMKEDIVFDLAPDNESYRESKIVW